MAEINTLELDLKVVIGQSVLTMRDIMRLGRGSVITLNDKQSRQFDRNEGDHRLGLTANDRQIGEARVRLNGADVHVEVL